METIDGPQRLMLGPVSWPLKLGGLTIVTAPLSRWWCGQSVLRRNCKRRMAVEHAIQNSMICLGGYSSIQMTTQRPFSSFSFSPFHKVTSMQHVKCCHKPPSFSAVEKEMSNKVGKKEHHLWMKRDSTGSGQKALNLVRIVSELPNEKEAVYGALDKWTAWETEFPLIAAVKALRILRKRNQWKRVIQVSKWMLSKGQGATMGTYDTLLLAFDMDWRVDEAESLWNMILHTHTRSISKRLFSRMISLYDHHDMQDKVIEVFSDMEELGVKPDEDTVMRVARAFQTLGQEDKQKLVLKKYQCKWKYIHFKGQRVRVRTDAWDEKC